MSKIEIPFNDWSKDKLRGDKKTATTRSKPYGSPGDTFEVDLTIMEFDGDIRTYELTLVTKKTLMVVANNHYDEEGAESPQEFIEVWNQLHPRRKYRPMDIKWFHKFKEI